MKKNLFLSLAIFLILLGIWQASMGKIEMVIFDGVWALVMIAFYFWQSQEKEAEDDDTNLGR